MTNYDLKIGRRFKNSADGCTYEVICATFKQGKCLNCEFYNDIKKECYKIQWCSNLLCMPADRKDGQSVYFIEVKYET